MAKNSTANVSVGKGVEGGYFHSAPLGTALPTDYSTALSDEFENLGYVSEDGFAESTDEDTTEVKDINGDTVLTETGSHKKTLAATLIETKKSTLQEYYGDDTVTDADGVITVLEKAGMREEKVYVIDLVLRGGRRERIIVPKGKVEEVEEIVYASGEVVGYGITINALPNDESVKTIRYIESTETQAASA